LALKVVRLETNFPVWRDRERDERSGSRREEGTAVRVIRGVKVGAGEYDQEMLVKESKGDLEVVEGSRRSDGEIERGECMGN
jgi:hypothetical protein